MGNRYEDSDVEDVVDEEDESDEEEEEPEDDDAEGMRDLFPSPANAFPNVKISSEVGPWTDSM